MIGIVEGPPHFPKPSLGSRPDKLADLESTLANVWREVLDLHGELDEEANFFDLGGNSLRSLMLCTAIEEQFGQQISAEDFFTLPTFASFLGLIANSLGERASAKNAPDSARSRAVHFPEKGADGRPEISLPWPLPSAMRNRLLASLETWPGERPTQDRVMLGLNTAGSKPPLFWVFNEQQEFRQLGRVLGHAQPLYAFRSAAGIGDYQEDDIQKFALRYISEIVEVCPDGPFFVGGNCQGAIIALAAAQHALRRQRHVPLLILLDWAFDLQSYAGRALLISERENLHLNAYRRFARPEFAWRRAFANFDFVELPGGYAFDQGTIAELGSVLALHMQSALSGPAVLMPACAYRATIVADGVPARLETRQQSKIKVTVKNDSDLIWRRTSESGLMVAGRWIDPDGDLIHQTYERASLPEIKPNASAIVDLRIIAPAEPGGFNLYIDICEEGNRWFNRDPKSAFFTPVLIVGRQSDFPGRFFKRLPQSRNVLPLRFSFGVGMPGVACLIFGWSVPERWGTWSDGSRAKLRLPVSDRYGRWRAVLTCKAFGAGDRPVSTYVRSGFDGNEIKWEIPANTIVQKEIELECKGSDITLQFSFPDAISPQRLLLSADRRRLGLGVIAMEIVQIS